ncbi:MAG: putative alpha-E superfamily protein [Bradyrhizobium sp.]|jgi:uncharacterized alpha-E superfamily protein
MLSRTADHLFWMARYTERAENTARMLDVNTETGLLPQSKEAAMRGWRALLEISELQELFDQKYPKLTPKDVLNFMVKDMSNPSSIASCMKRARENARAVRGTLTTEVWETHNATWLELQGKLRDGELEEDPIKLFEWVKYRSHLSRGVTIGTTLKDEAFYFIRIGTFLERADNTARILDVKFHGTGPNQPQPHEQQIDFYYWAALLRSVSAFEIYRKVYRDVITPARVAELLILRENMPRSLLACMTELVSNLRYVGTDSSRETERLAGIIQSELQYGRIADIQAAGLDNYLTGFLERIGDLGARVSRDFLVPLAA